MRDTPGETMVTHRDLGVTAIVALVARALVSVVAGNRFLPADDGTFYDILARRLADGLGYTWAWPDGVITPVAHYPVGYPALLAFGYRVLGAHPASALVLHSIIGVAGAVSIHIVASVGMSRFPARWAGFAAALHPALLFYVPALMTEGVTAGLLAIPFALAVSAARGESSRRRLALALSAGVSLGVTALVRPQALLLAPLVAWLAWHAVARGKRWAAPLLVAVGVTVAVAPWTLRNARALGRPVLVSANGGWNLLIGTDPAANGGWRALEAPEACRTVWDEAAKDVCFGHAAEARILAHPLDWLMLAPAKLAATFDLGGTGPSYLSRSRPDLVSHDTVLAVGGIETLVDRLFLLAALIALAREPARYSRARRGLAFVSGLFLLVRHAWPAYVGLTLLLSLLGVRRLAARPLLGVTWGVLGSTLLTHAVFFGASRYALLVMPWVAATAASCWRERRSGGQPATATTAHARDEATDDHEDPAGVGSFGRAADRATS